MIELLGDTSRAPVFTDEINKKSEKQTARKDLVKRTMNSEICLARGATLQSALSSSSPPEVFSYSSVHDYGRFVVRLGQRELRLQ